MDEQQRFTLADDLVLDIDVVDVRCLLKVGLIVRCLAGAWRSSILASGHSPGSLAAMTSTCSMEGDSANSSAPAARSASPLASR
ncbi:MAG: hypothetical protein JWQ95_4969 [Sphaerisporangium sp.]|nr:hypothetical protein [Sphaerisporangium sp.]